jgi:hypothetical protein
MAVMMKIIIYGRYHSGKYALALQLVRDNPFLGEPVVLNDTADMTRFLAAHKSTVGIVCASSVHLIMGKSREEKFGSVLFVAAPGAIDVTEEAPARVERGHDRLITPSRG